MPCRIVVLFFARIREEWRPGHVTLTDEFDSAGCCGSGNFLAIVLVTTTRTLTPILLFIAWLVLRFFLETVFAPARLVQPVLCLQVSCAPL